MILFWKSLGKYPPKCKFWIFLGGVITGSLDFPLGSLMKDTCG